MSGPAAHPPQPPVDLPKRVKHGGLTAYQKYKCRCLACQTFHRNYQRAAEALRRRLGRIPEYAEHGTTGTYNYYGCRCLDCRDARYVYDRARWEARNPGRTETNRKKR